MKCKICGITFSGNKLQQVCSFECAKERKRIADKKRHKMQYKKRTNFNNGSIITCKQCKKKVISNNYQRIYCSHECRYKSKRKKHEQANCKTCGNIFNKKSKNHLYCSYICRNNTKKPDKKNCKNCKKEFKPYTSLDKFCSANCREENKKKGRKCRWSKESCEKRKGKNNPCYRNGSRINGRNYPVKHFRENAKYKKEFLDKYGYIFCEHCKNSNAIKYETHHIIFASEAPKHENLHNRKNQIILCIKCHNEFHKKKSKRDSLVKERNLSELFPDLKYLRA